MRGARCEAHEARGERRKQRAVSREPVCTGVHACMRHVHPRVHARVYTHAFSCMQTHVRARVHVHTCASTLGPSFITTINHPRSFIDHHLAYHRPTIHHPPSVRPLARPPTPTHPPTRRRCRDCIAYCLLRIAHEWVLFLFRSVRCIRPRQCRRSTPDTEPVR